MSEKPTDGWLSSFLGRIAHHPGLFPRMPDALVWMIGPIVAMIGKGILTDRQIHPRLFFAMAVGMLAHIGIGHLNGLYTHRWRVSTFDEVFALAQAWFGGSVVIIVTALIMRSLSQGLSMSDLGTSSLLALVFLLASRVVWRRFWESRRGPSAGARPTIIFGAGSGGEKVIRSLKTDLSGSFRPVALIDDDPYKAKRIVEGVPVKGTREDIERVAAATGADALLMAMPSADAELLRELREISTSAGLELLVVPTTSSLIEAYSLSDFQPPQIDDLLGRNPVELDLEVVTELLESKRVLVTGAGGSIGSEISAQLASIGNADLFFLDRDESALHGLELRLSGRALLASGDLIVGNIRDRERMFEVFETIQPDIVFHTAALKHLPLLEAHPLEGLKTNIEGTRNLLDAAASVGVQKFVNISTDKAADPTSILGITKLVGERLTARTAEKSAGTYVSVRFGNVLGTRGSVVPTFIDQLRRGLPLTVTHKDVTRYFMTPTEAASLVIQAGAIGRDGEVLILDMGEPVKIADLAAQLIELLRPGTPIRYTELRPGEKMHESLRANNEVGDNHTHPRIYHTTGSTQIPQLPETLVNDFVDAEVS